MPALTPLEVDRLEVNDLAPLEQRFVDPVTDAVVDPSSVVLTVTRPDGTTLTAGGVGPAYAGLVHPETGVFRYVLAASQKGGWQWRFDAGSQYKAETGYLSVGGAPRTTLNVMWNTVDALKGHPALPDDLQEGVLEAGLLAASDLLYRWTGFRYPGLAYDSVRPCSRNTWLPGVRTWDIPMGWGSNWWNWLPLGQCQCQASVHRTCGCQLLSEITLGRSPVVQIVQVRQDGAVIAPSAYRVDDYQWLVRIDGLRWPCCQDLTKDDHTSPNTFGVDYLYGLDPPPAGKFAAVDLAVELLKGYSREGPNVPERVTTSIRQGTTMMFLPPASYGRDSSGHVRTGIRSVDFFLSSVPTSRPALIASPDSNARVRRTGTA